MARFLLEQYEQHRQEGIAAHKAGDRRTARYHLLKAAEYLYREAGESGGSLAGERKKSAAKLVEMARRIDLSEPQRTPAQARQASDGEVTEEDSRRWIVTHKPGVRFDDVAGLEDVKAVVRRRVIYPLLHPEATHRYRKKAGGGVLLYGPPGTGKTMIAKAIATELDATFFSVKCSDIMSKWVGEAEKNLKKLFDTARASSRAVVFMDETEAIVARRGGDSTVMNRVIPEFLAQVDGLESGEATLLLLGATNRPWDMDEASLRSGRFGELIYVGLPDLPARLDMLCRALKDVPMADDVTIEDLAGRTESYTGADIKGLVERMTDRPFEREIQTGQPSQIVKADVDEALSKTRLSVTPAMLAKYTQFQKR